MSLLTALPTAHRVFVAGGDSMTVTGYATTEASNEKYMYFKIAFWEAV